MSEPAADRDADGATDLPMPAPEYIDGQVTGRYGPHDDEPLAVAGHDCIRVAVRHDDGQKQMMYQCVDCGRTTNSVTGFDQFDCPADDGGPGDA